MNTLFIFGAEYLIFISLLIAGIYFLKQPWHQKKAIFIIGLLTLLLIGIMGFLANQAFKNPRPFVTGHFTPLIPHDADNGFPSDHVLLAAGIAAIVFLFNSKTGIVLGLIAALIGISRVYVGVHHTLDVVCSYLIAIISTYVTYSIHRKIGNRQLDSKII